MTFLLATLIPFVGVTLAAPSLQFRQVSNTTAASNGTRAGGATTELTFSGAGASFNVTAPLDGSSFIVPNAMSVDFISQTSAGSCSFTGINGVKLTVLGASKGATIAPPQTIRSGSCSRA